MKYSLLLMVFLVTGCAQVQLVTSNENSVAVKGPIEAWAKTQPLADAACAKFGKGAAFKYNTGGYPATYFYDCVK
jgi:phage baseplate assembly protein gpV